MYLRKKTQLQYEGGGRLMGAVSGECVLLSSDCCQQMEADRMDTRPLSSHSSPATTTTTTTRSSVASNFLTLLS